MSFTLVNSNGALLEVRILGVMTFADQCALQDKARELIAKGLSPSVLAVLQDFQGWEKDARWEDTTFLHEHGDSFERLAIVGAERWRDEVLMFTAKGLRATEIEYFELDDLAHAREWVNQAPHVSTTLS
jgi:hypothetical protein